MTNFFHVIKDPVHGTMQFTSMEDAWVKPFIDSANFQRLRHIKQLGLGDFIFPGAVHTRFNHCLGCCYIASQIAHKIGLSDEERQLVMIACLMHDIGHGPFSHAFEDLFSNKDIRHEDWTPCFLADYQAHFFDKYNELNPDFPLDEKTFQEIANMIMHKTKCRTVLSDIVSSQLDADRLDYLLRDNHFCGVKYGEFDFRWMLHCMTIVEVNGNKRLGITHKGIGVVEHYLMARRLMTRNIYHSQKKLSFERWLVDMLAGLSLHLGHHPSLKKSRLGQFLNAVNQYNAQEVNKQAFLKENYLNYKELCDYDIFAAIKLLASSETCDVATEIARRLQYRLMPKIVRLDHRLFHDMIDEVNTFKAANKDIQPFQIMLIETPHRSYSHEEDPILVMNELAHIQPIGKFSMMLNAMADELEHTAFLAIDPTIYNDKRMVKFIEHLRKRSI